MVFVVVVLWLLRLLFCFVCVVVSLRLFLFWCVLLLCYFCGVMFVRCCFFVASDGVVVGCVIAVVGVDVIVVALCCYGVMDVLLACFFVIVWYCR